MLRARYPSYKFPYKSQWVVWTDVKLEALLKTNEPLYMELDTRIAEYQMNPLRFALLHGAKRRGKYKNDGIACANDYKNDLILLMAPNRVGKSYLGAIFMGLRCIPTEPEWECFTEHELEHYPWKGPQDIVIASYEWTNVKFVWQRYQEILPRSELGRYAPRWGMFPGEEGSAKSPTFKHGPSTVPLTCGTNLTFLGYSQKQTAFEGFACDAAHLDEQCPEDKFDGLCMRMTGRGEYTPIIMTLTPHVVDDRPDTGAGGWIIQKLLNTKMTKGRKFAQYRMTVKDTPDAIYDKKKKEVEYIHCVAEPLANKDERGIRSGRARYYGEPQVGGNIILDSWNPDIHMIEPFELKPHNPTYFRMIDHGENPCAALLIAMLPWGDAVCFKEYYEFGNSIAKNAEQMVEMCGNKRMKLDPDEFEGTTWAVYDEVQCGIEFYSSEMDCRSFNTHSPESRRLIGSIYQQAGLRCSPSAAFKYVDIKLPLKEWFSLEEGRPYIDKRLNRKYNKVLDKYGSPRMYAFNDMIHLKAEIEGWMEDPNTGKPPNKNDHLISALSFFAARHRIYQGKANWNEEDNYDEQSAKRPVRSATGW